jgi:outer membrane assembly lipoprotein YfiO
MRPGFRFPVSAALAALALAGLSLSTLAGCGSSVGTVRYAPGEDSFIAGRELYGSGDMGECASALKAYLDASPGGPHAEEASFLLGAAYTRLKQYPLAEVELRHFMDLYPASPRLAEVEYRLAVCYWEDARPASFDQEKTTFARDQLKRFLTLYPESPLVPDAKALLSSVRDRLAEKAVLNARLYTHLNQPGSTVFYAERVLGEYGDTKWAAEAAYLKGVALQAQGKGAEGREVLARLVRDLPDSEWAVKAREKLAESAPEKP